MHALITGGTGFLGKKLAAALLRGPGGLDVSRITLFDAGEGFDVPADPRLAVVTGDIADPAAVAAVAADADLVWHLAAVVSYGAEHDVDLGYRVNLDGTRMLLGALRAAGRRPRLVFASSYAVFGGDLPAEITDDFHTTPQTSYGAQKAIGELLVADHARKGFVDGRSVRLPTVVVRPGRPNLAASTFASSIIREPLAGAEAVCPVGRGTSMLVLSPRRVVASLVRAMTLPAAAFGADRSLSLPGLCVTVGEMVEALERVAGPQAVARIRWQPDPAIQRIVETWPVRTAARRAEALGFTADASFDEIVRAHVEDELS